jgi:hypothetical protein
MSPQELSRYQLCRYDILCLLPHLVPQQTVERREWGRSEIDEDEEQKMKRKIASFEEPVVASSKEGIYLRH